MKLKDLYAHELALVRYLINNLDGQIEGLHNLLVYDDLDIDDILKILKHDLNDLLDLIERFTALKDAKTVKDAKEDETR